MVLDDKNKIYTTSIPRRPKPQVSDATKIARGIFGLLGMGAGVWAGIYTANEYGSIWLSIFVAGAALYFVARVVPDVMTRPKKVRRTLYYLLYPALAVGILYLAYQWWDTWWLAVVLAWVVGLVLNLILASLLFPDILREVGADDIDRMRHMGS